ncbi:hypothetical protein [Phenylobacterium sp.]|uniref:hypothetical protein n=1 Tax=Phenylobacterium sp. TaxID=1871053 RepID=UPI00301BA69A
MKSAVGMGLALALFGGAAWSATVDATVSTPAPVQPAPVQAALVGPDATLPGDEGGDPFAVREKPADGPLAMLGLDKSSPLPDPASWAMMIIGFFGAGYLLRSGRSGGLRALRAVKAGRPVGGKGDTATR